MRNVLFIFPSCDSNQFDYFCQYYDTFGQRTTVEYANGNQLGWNNPENESYRKMQWDEENRIQSIDDNGQTSRYIYNDKGERSVQETPTSETLYVNAYYVVRGSVESKHIFAGTQRITTKIVQDAHDKNGYRYGHHSYYYRTHHDKYKYENQQYFYHPDHLGSASYMTDAKGAVYEHIEYLPFGETWVEEQHKDNSDTPYKFTGKELDTVTGLYYYGARYYDPRTSVWQSPDPILEQYMPTGDKEKDKKLSAFDQMQEKQIQQGEKEKDKQLPAGGVYNPKNFGMYTYTANNPVSLIDPDGKIPVVAVIFAPEIVSAVVAIGLAYAAATSEKVQEAVSSLIYEISAKDLREQQRAQANEQKHGDAEWEEPAPEAYGKWQAKEAEKKAAEEGKNPKDERRKLHDEKFGTVDRTKSEFKNR